MKPILNLSDSNMLDPRQFAEQANTARMNLFDFSADAQAKPTISTQSVSRPQSMSKSLSRDEVKRLLEQATDKKQALQNLVNSGYILEGLNDSVQAQPKPESSTLANIGAGIASGASQAVGGALGILGDVVSAPFSEDVSLKGIFTGENKGGLGQVARDEALRQQQSGAQAFGADMESAGYKGAKLGTGLGLSIAAPGGVFGKAKDVGTLGKVGLGATQGVIETGKFLGLTEGRLGTPTELATGAAIGGAIPVVGAGLGKAKAILTQTPEEKLVKQAESYFGKTVPAKFGDTIVDIPLPDQGVIAKSKNLITKPFQETDTKRLANSAIKPTVYGKNAKARIYGVETTEKNAREFHKAIRTGQLSGQIDTLENAARSIVDNIDVVGARI